MLSRMRSLWNNIWHRTAVERDLDDELQAYVAELNAENLHRGMTPNEAWRSALIAVGGIQSVKQGVRDVRTGAALEGVAFDIRFALRSLRKTPGFTAIALATLALGIGANTALFSVADEVFLKSLPVRKPEQLVLLQWTSGPRWIGGTIAGMSIDPVTGALASTAFSKLTYERFREQSTKLASVFAFTNMTPIELSDSQPAFGQLVSGNYFAALGVRPAAGRLLLPDDDRETAPAAAVISYRFWQRRFGLGPNAIGATLTLRTPVARSVVTIVGVTPPGFAGTQQLGSSPDVTLPVALARTLGFEGKSSFATPWYWPLRVMGRLRPEASFAEVRAELQGVLAATALEGWRAMPRQRPNPDIPRLDVTPGGKGLVDARRSLQQVIQIMAVIVGLVLLIVCSNLANLLLARSAARERETAIRAAMGARRGRLVRLLLSESALLALAGGALGIVVAYWGKDLVLAWIQRANPWFALEPQLDLRVLGFTLATSLLTGLGVGAIPALRASKVDLTQPIKDGSRTSGGPRSYISRTLMVAQVAISVVLLVGAGLLLQTVRNLRTAEVGFNTTNVLLFDGATRGDAIARRPNDASALALYDNAIAQLAQIPGARQATYSQYPLLSGDFAMPFLFLPDRPALAGEDRTVYLQQVHPTFFETMQMPLILGRGLTLDDRRLARAVVVNESLARRFFRDGNPLGRRIGISKSPTTAEMPDSELVEIVGVVRDAKFTSVRQDVPITVFGPARAGRVTFAIRSAVDPVSLIPQVRALAQREGTFTFDGFRTQDAAAAQTFAEEQHFAMLTSLFGALATALACLGLYGLMSHQVSRRTREIGVRMALGARRGLVLRMVLVETVALAGFGIGIGVVASLAFTRLLATLLFQIPSHDPMTLGVAGITMLSVAALAGYVPGWRAAKVDPMVALRAQ